MIQFYNTKLYSHTRILVPTILFILGLPGFLFSSIPKSDLLVIIVIISSMILVLLIIIFTAPYKAQIEINDDFVRVNNKLMEWDKMSSYDFKEDDKWIMLTLRDQSGQVIQLLGLPYGKYYHQNKMIFNEIESHIYTTNTKRKLSGRELIRVKNFMTSVYAKILGYCVTMFVIIATFYLYELGKMNVSTVLGLANVYLMLFLFLFEVFRNHD